LISADPASKKEKAHGENFEGKEGTINDAVDFGVD
jgi:hypothetical protein